MVGVNGCRLEFLCVGAAEADRCVFEWFRSTFTVSNLFNYSEIHYGDLACYVSVICILCLSQEKFMCSCFSRVAAAFRALQLLFARCSCLSRVAAACRALQLLFARCSCLSRVAAAFRALQLLLTRLYTTTGHVVFPFVCFVCGIHACIQVACPVRVHPVLLVYSCSM